MLLFIVSSTEDCPSDPCEDNEICRELPCPNNFTCEPIVVVGDDPHFAVGLPDGKLLCYTVQGEHGFAFNLISNKRLYMNAMFVPDAKRKEVTWLGNMGIVIKNHGLKKTNMTKLRFQAIKNLIHIDDQMSLDARNIDKLTFENGKLTISEALPVEGYKQPMVRIDLVDVELSFSIKFMTEHLDLFWHSTGQKLADSHGLIGKEAASVFVSLKYKHNFPILNSVCNNEGIDPLTFIYNTIFLCRTIFPARCICG